MVGAKFHSTSGSAYLLSYDATTRRWDHAAEFVPGGASANGAFDGTSQGSSYDQFGFDVAVSRDWVAVSAPLDVAGTGKVSLYRLDDVRGGDRLEPHADLVAADGEYQARFGSSLAVDGMALAVGAARDRDGVGSAYVFRHAAGGWTQAAKLAPDDASRDSQGNFGLSIAVLDDDGVVVVGAPYDGTQGRRRNGSVYVYSSSGQSAYALVQKIVPSELLGGDQFGYSLAAETSADPDTNAKETRIAIGARLRDDKGIDSGAVYVYVRREGDAQFSLEQRLVSQDWSPGAELGTDVTMYDRRIIAGAKKRGGHGGAHYFRLEGATWSEKGVVTPSNAAAGNNDGDDFGSAVALTSGVALVGSYSNDDVGEDGGTMYSYAVCD